MKQKDLSLSMKEMLYMIDLYGKKFDLDAAVFVLVKGYFALRWLKLIFPIQSGQISTGHSVFCQIACSIPSHCLS